MELAAAEEGSHKQDVGHTGSQAASPTDSPEHAAMQNGHAQTGDGIDSNLGTSPSGKNLPVPPDGSAGHAEDTEAHIIGEHAWT